MSTLELLIVFAALMAVISLVAIAIDWVGRPLRNRRFIPRIYRYDDERGPDPLAPIVHGPPLPMMPAPAHPGVQGPLPVPVQAAPVVVATVAPVGAAAAPAAPAPQPAAATTDAPTVEDIGDELPSGQRGPEPASTGGNAFSEAAASDDDLFGGRAPRGVAQTIPVAAAPAWHPGMALDARAGTRKPTVAVKAERFWKETAAHLTQTSHFDERNRRHMIDGKAPRRRNPRTGDTELMELVGLRSASDRSDVRMRWPDDAVDPWSSS